MGLAYLEKAGMLKGYREGYILYQWNSGIQNVEVKNNCE